jgi:AraC family transcriptional regulator, regulatory protein of adaptative response / DNA-3-methyladenine glycosylase II
MSENGEPLGAAPAIHHDMELDRQRCYRAVLSRDGRFDGRFFTAVTTTGIYCRPICPARPPKLENVRFYACAAAAEEAGFRPCLRCRPETAPGTPAWSGTSSTVARAMRLIAAGALDGDGGDVDALAARLGVGSRHLRRLFDEHLGASPITIAQTRRAHFASRLIEETDLPMTQVALASGFSSLRRFNAAIVETFGRAPTAIRTAATGRRPTNGGGLCLRLPYRKPYDWGKMIAFLGDRAIPGVEEAGTDFYRRTVLVGKRATVIEVRPVPGKTELSLRIHFPDPQALPRVVDRVRRVFDLDADPFAIAAHLAHDPLLAASVRAHPGLRLPGAWDPFEIGVRAILGQQVTVKGARTLAARLVARHGTPVAAPLTPGLTHLFPCADDLATARIESIGIPRARAEAIREFARAVATRRLSLEPGCDPEIVRGGLTDIPGIGEWTAAYIAMRALGEPDVFPAGDIVLRRALASHKPLSPKVAETLADAWRPWRSYAVLHIWAQAAARKETKDHANPRRRA